jgi:hypothetical protein
MRVMEIVIGSIGLKWNDSHYVPRELVAAVYVMPLQDSPDVVEDESDCVAFWPQKYYSTEGRKVIRYGKLQRVTALSRDRDCVIYLVMLLVEMLV